MSVYQHELMDQLVKQKNFILFSNQILMQTFRMKEKTSLTVSDTFSEEKKIVKIRDSAVSYIDDQFCKNRFHELDESEAKSKNNLYNGDEQYITYPVIVKALRMDWILS